LQIVYKTPGEHTTSTTSCFISIVIRVTAKQPPVQQVMKPPFIRLNATERHRWNRSGDLKLAQTRTAKKTPAQVSRWSWSEHQQHRKVCKRSINIYVVWHVQGEHLHRDPLLQDWMWSVKWSTNQQRARWCNASDVHHRPTTRSVRQKDREHWQVKYNKSTRSQKVKTTRRCEVQHQQTSPQGSSSSISNVLLSSAAASCGSQTASRRLIWPRGGRRRRRKICNSQIFN
jgi:hypothetical protein